MLCCAWRLCRAAYATETRKTILTMHKVTKTAPSGKVLLNNVSLGMYLGAKIGILGANGGRYEALKQSDEDTN